MNAQDRMQAFYRFEARANFVKQLAAELQIPTGGYGAILIEQADKATKDAFFNQLDLYDKEVAKQA